MNEINPPLLAAVSRLVALLRSPQDIPFLHQGIQREILYRVLLMPAGEQLRRVIRLGTGANGVARAVSWLRTHYARKTSIAHLAQIAGMAAPTLFKKFRALTQMSPLGYQKRLRLTHARRMLLEQAADIATAAYRVGYESPTQFSREYRRLYGRSPAEDARRLRMTF